LNKDQVFFNNIYSQIYLSTLLLYNPVINLYYLNMNELISQWNNPEIIKQLNLLKEKILKEEYKEYKKEWGGAGIIVTSNKEDDRKADIKIITKHAKPITYLLYKLKDIYKEYIDYSNKREFYAYVVNIIDKEGLEREENSGKILIHIIDKLSG